MMHNTFLILLITVCAVHGQQPPPTLPIDTTCHPPKTARDTAPCDVKLASYHCVAQTRLNPTCPTSGNVSCPQGFYCPILPYPTNQTVMFPCPNGGVCAERTSCVFSCPRGYWCQNGSMPQPCPKGHYCRAGTSNPIPCTFFDFCGDHEGLHQPRAEIFGSIVVISCIIACFVIVFVSRYCIDIQQQRTQEHVISNTSSFKIADAISPLNVPGKRPTEGTRLINERPSTPTSAFVPMPPSASTDSLSILRDEAQHDGSAHPTVDFICDGARLQLKGPGPLRRLVNAIFRIDFKPLTILESVSCIIRPGTVTAIMGPSGGGKTSLMNVLSGKAWAYGDVSGECRMSGQDLTPQLIKDMQHFIGFVPQDDVMPRQCTVNENLNFQARGRLPPEMPRDSIRLRVAACTDALGLGRISASRIGDENVRGISGGQRKRVNIGMEVVAQPSVIFLDEPTSGLDSTTSLVVCDFLKDLADLCGTTIISVIHQPRYEIFEKFDNLVLLAPGGHVVYSGAVSGVREYFAEFGYEVPANCNPADFYMDVISADSKVVSTKPGVTVETLIEENKRRFRAERDEYYSEQFTEDAINRRTQTGYFTQFRMFLGRSMTLLYVRQPARLLLEALICCGGAALLGFALPSAVFVDVTTQFALGSLLFVLFSHFSALPVFGPELSIAKREISTGFKPLAYFLGKDIASMPKLLYLPLLFSLHYTIIAPRVLFWEYLVVFLSMGYAAYGTGMLLSAALPESTAQMAAVLTSFVALLFSGYSPTLETIWAAAPNRWLGEVVTGAFPIRWALDALLSSEYQRNTEFWRVCTNVMVYGSGFNAELSLWWKCSMMIMLGVLVRMIAFFVVRAKTRQ